MKFVTGTRALLCSIARMICPVISRILSWVDAALMVIVSHGLTSVSWLQCEQCGGAIAGKRAVNGSVHSSANKWVWRDVVFCFKCASFPCGVSDCDNAATDVISGKLAVGSRPSVDVPADFPVCATCRDKIVRYQIQHLMAWIIGLLAFFIFMAFLLGDGVLGHFAFGGTVETLSERLMSRSPVWGVLKFLTWILVIALAAAALVIEYRALRAVPRKRKVIYELKVVGSAGSIWKDEGVPGARPFFNRQ